MKTRRITLAALVALAWVLGAARADEPTLGWSLVQDGGGALDDFGVTVLADTAGNPILGGVQTPAVGGANLLVRKLDRASGAVLWTYAYADPDGNDMVLADLVLDRRGQVLVAGYLSACDS